MQLLRTHRAGCIDIQLTANRYVANTNRILLETHPIPYISHISSRYVCMCVSASLPLFTYVPPVRYTIIWNWTFFPYAGLQQPLKEHNKKKYKQRKKEFSRRGERYLPPRIIGPPVPGGDSYENAENWSRQHVDETTVREKTEVARVV
jgi:hypothetical protein